MINPSHKSEEAFLWHVSKIYCGWHSHLWWPLICECKQLLWTAAPTWQSAVGDVSHSEDQLMSQHFASYPPNYTDLKHRSIFNNHIQVCHYIHITLHIQLSDRYCSTQCEFWGFCGDMDEVSVVLRCGEVLPDIWFLSFWDNIVVSSTRVKKSSWIFGPLKMSNKIFWPLKMRPVCFLKHLEINTQWQNLTSKMMATLIYTTVANLVSFASFGNWLSYRHSFLVAVHIWC